MKCEKSPDDGISSACIKSKTRNLLRVLKVIPCKRASCGALFFRQALKPGSYRHLAVNFIEVHLPPVFVGRGIVRQFSYGFFCRVHIGW